MAGGHHYKRFQKLMSIALLADLGLFLLYFLFAALGVLWLKVILALLILGGSAVGLWILFSSQELLRQRSLWLSCGFFAIFICCLVSLILNYPG